MELPQLGKQCDFEVCQQLDFLPIICNQCHLKFCKEHFSPDNHVCTAHKALFQKISDVQKFPCSQAECQTTSPVKMICPVCKLHFCLEHRHHGCIDKEQSSRTQELEQWLAPQEQFRVAKEEVDHLVDKSLCRARKRIGSSKTANKVQLMRLKAKATGSKTIPTDDRVYFLVIPPLSTKSSGKAVFISRLWSLGRAIDATADVCGVINRNNYYQSPKLRLFGNGDGRIVSSNMDKKVEELLSEEVIFNGETLILEYISSEGDLGVDCLKNLELYKL